MSDIRDAGPRLRQMNDVLEENERLRGRLALTERERDSLRKSIQNLRDYVVEQNCEIELLRSENPFTRRIASEFLRRPYCGQNCDDAKNDAIRPQSAAKTDTTQPRNGALSGCETVPDPDSRVWETPCTPQPQRTPTQGSVPGEDSFRDSRNAKDPVAWAVAGDYGEYAVKLCFDEASAVLEADRRCRVGLRPDYVVVPLFRQPQPTLTDEELEAVRFARNATLADQRRNLFTHPEYATLAERHAATLGGLLERLGGER